MLIVTDLLHWHSIPSGGTADSVTVEAMDGSHHHCLRPSVSFLLKVASNAKQVVAWYPTTRNNQKRNQEATINTTTTITNNSNHKNHNNHNSYNCRSPFTLKSVGVSVAVPKAPHSTVLDCSPEQIMLLVPASRRAQGASQHGYWTVFFSKTLEQFFWHV